jgi:uncharacterized protein
LRGEIFELSDRDFRILHRACAGHTHERTHPDETIQTCWDADRLDLGRVGITPSPYFLNTAIAKRPEVLLWADERATTGIIPERVKNDWQLDLQEQRYLNEYSQNPNANRRPPTTDH